MENSRKYKAFYFRHGLIDFEKFKEIEKATEYLSTQEEEGNICGIGVYDQNEKIFYPSDNIDIFVASREEALLNKLSDLKKIGIETLKVVILEKQ